MYYEQLRLANIRRNNEELASLGLANARPAAQHTTSSKRSRSINNNTEQHNDTPVPSRRSARLLNVPAIMYREKALERLDCVQTQPQQQPRNAKRQRPIFQTLPKSDTHVLDNRRQIKQETINLAISELFETTTVLEDEDRLVASFDTPQGPSTKLVDARVNELTSEWVGKLILPPPGSGSLKAAVMSVIGKQRPKFSKYSGIQEFRNAIVLFVNVDRNTGYDNMFVETQGTNTHSTISFEGASAVTTTSQAVLMLCQKQTILKQECAAEDSKSNDHPVTANSLTSPSSSEAATTSVMKRAATMTWFAQARQHPETPVIERLVSGTTPVLLFCRLPSSPYVCCGQVELESYKPEVSPMKFTWRISAWHRLVENSKPFQEIMCAAR